MNAALIFYKSGNFRLKSCLFCMQKVAYKEPEAGIFEVKRWHLWTTNKCFSCEKVPFVVSKPYCKGPCLRRLSFYSDVFQLTY